MQRLSIYTKLWIVCSILCLAVATWALRVHKPAAHTSPAAMATAMLDTLPASSGSSLTDQAIDKWAARVRENIKDGIGWVNLGDALMQKVRETADAGYYGRAEKAYQQALALNPRDVAALIGMAWVNGGRHEFERSVEWAHKALALDPNNNDAYGLLGDADIELGDYDAAYEHYQRMLDLRPDLSSYSRGAHLLWLTGDTRKAILLMAKAIKIGGPYAENTAWCRAQLGLMLLSIGARPAAEQTLKAALKWTPNNYQVLAAMGKVQAAKGNYPAAIDYYKKAIAVVPMHDSLVTLGDLYRLTGNQAEAEKQYQLVETIHQLQRANGVRGDWQIAQFYADHDRNLPEALRLIEAEYTTRKNVYVADTLAWCYYKNGRYAQAQDMSEKALSRRTPEALFRYHAGMIDAKLGDRRSAQLSLYQALSQNPYFSPIYAPIAVDALKQLGSQPPSIEHS